MANGTTILIALTLGVVFFGLIGYLAMMYNGLVRLKRDTNEAWSNIDVLLKQRSDEIPKLVDAAQEYMDYEQEVMNEITQARNKVQKASSPQAKAEADEQMRGALGNFFAVAEDYPNLKSSEQFQQLQQRVSDIEDQIADRREFYNQSVNNYNTRIHQIPYNLMANAIGYSDKELFEATEKEKQDISISKQFEQ
jgi:LemA protein